MSEDQQERPAPAWVGEKGFISTLEWAGLEPAARAEWVQFAQDVGWLLDQPQFRRVVFTFINDARFCATDTTPRRASAEDTWHAIGVQDAGRMLRLVLQAVDPRKWMRVLHEAFNSVSDSRMPPRGKE